MSGWFGKDTDWNDARRLETALSALRSTGAGHDPVSLDINADTVLEIPGVDGDPQQIGLDTQAANTVWAGPTAGVDAIPTFRALVVADIPAHTLLSATHGDTVTNTVARGSLVFGNATPAWDELTHPGGAGYALTTDANDVMWDQTPAWTGLHTFGAGWVLSGGTGDLNGLDLILDADADSYLHAAGDDHAEFVLATASGQLDVNINGADDFTFTANAFNVAVGSGIVMGNGCTIGQAAGPLLTFDDTNDLLEITGCKVGIGTTTVPHAGVGIAMLALDGVAGAAGPNVQFTTTADDYPLLQILPLVHDNISILLDAYYDGANTRSSDAGSNFAILKNGDALQFRHEAGVAAGNVVTWGVAMQIVATGDITIGSTSVPSGTLMIHQDNAAGAQAPLYLVQADLDREFITYYGASLDGNLTYSLVEEGDQGSETREGWVKVWVQDIASQITSGPYYMPFYSLSA